MVFSVSFSSDHSVLSHRWLSLLNFQSFISIKRLKYGWIQVLFVDIHWPFCCSCLPVNFILGITRSSSRMSIFKISISLQVFPHVFTCDDLFKVILGSLLIPLCGSVVILGSVNYFFLTMAPFFIGFQPSISSYLGRVMFHPSTSQASDTGFLCVLVTLCALNGAVLSVQIL